MMYQSVETQSYVSVVVLCCNNVKNVLMMLHLNAVFVCVSLYLFSITITDVLCKVNYMDTSLHHAIGHRTSTALSHYFYHQYRAHMNESQQSNCREFDVWKLLGVRVKNRD